jgi:hypothetical protein
MASTKFGGCLSQPRCGALAFGATPASSFDGMFRDRREEVVAPGIPGQLNRMLRVRRGLPTPPGQISADKGSQPRLRQDLSRCTKGQAA